MIAKAINKFYIENNKLRNTQDFDKINQDDRDGCLYEVLRIIQKQPLFVEDHFERLLKSAKLVNKEIILDDISQFKANIDLLIEKNEIQNGNIRIDVICNFPQKILCYQVEAIYPSEEEYNYGVSAVLQFDERKIPNAKTFHKDLREKANQIKKQLGVYETILVNSKNQITEGSKSNLFFVKDNCIYSAEENLILPGITRKHIINLISKFQINYQEKNIEVKDLKQFDAAFISGTSPIILPLKKINDIEFNVNNNLIRKLMSEFKLT